MLTLKCDREVDFLLYWHGSARKKGKKTAITRTFKLYCFSLQIAFQTLFPGVLSCAAENITSAPFDSCCLWPAASDFSHFSRARGERRSSRWRRRGVTLAQVESILTQGKELKGNPSRQVAAIKPRKAPTNLQGSVNTVGVRGGAALNGAKAVPLRVYSERCHWFTRLDVKSRTIAWCDNSLNPKLEDLPVFCKLFYNNAGQQQ